MRNKEIGFKIHTLDLILRRRMLANAKENGIDEASAMHGWIVGVIYDSKEDIFQKDIEARCHIARSSVTGILQLMEKNGYIKRESVDYDARLKKLVLTEKGVSLHKTKTKHHKEMEQIMAKDLTELEKQEFIRLADKIINSLKEAEK